MRRLLAVLLVAGCASAQTVLAPDGRSAHLIECSSNHQGRCYSKAAELCPAGYNMLNQSESSPQGIPLPSGGLLIKSESRFLIRCR